MKITFQYLCTRKVLHSALKTSLIVGSVLNLINQGDLLLAMEFETVNWNKILLTYSIPFMVSGYSIAKTNTLIAV